MYLMLVKSLKERLHKSEFINKEKNQMSHKTKKYSNLTLEEIIDSYERYGDRVLLHNGQVVGFEKDEDTEWR